MAMSKECFSSFNKLYMTINDNKNQATNSKKSSNGIYHGIYGLCVFGCNNKKIISWTFRINKLHDIWGQSHPMIIGIDESNTKFIDGYFYCAKGAYAYMSNGRGYDNGVAIGNDNGKDEVKYGDTFKPNDIVSMVFNGINNTLSFLVNNKKQPEIKIKNTDKKYKMCVMLGWEGDSIELLSFDIQNKINDNDEVLDEKEIENENDNNTTKSRAKRTSINSKQPPVVSTASFEDELYDEMYDDISKAQTEFLKSELTLKQKEINNFKNEIKLLKEKNNKLMYDNGKLLDDQKGMEIEINKLKKENKELRRNNINTKNYKQWNWEQIIFWILSLDDGKYNQYENQLMKHLKEEAIEGDDLTEIKEDDLMRWGIKKFKDKKNVMKYIKQLTNNNHQNVDNEGGKPAPTAYI
eukprot:470048_1